MGNKNFLSAYKPGGAKKLQQASSYSKDAAASQGINIQIMQNVLLLWLDNTIDDNSADCRNTISQLRRVVNTINKYTDGKKCVKFLENMNNEKACMIISGSLGQHIVPRVHNMPQVDSIFIFCSNKKHHEQWTKDWPKIKGVFTEIAPICEALKKAAQECEHNSIPMSFMDTTGDMSKTNLDQLNPTFMYTQIMKEILLTIEFQPKHIKEFIDYCREQFADNESEMENVNKLERKYRHETPIWWYTYECFLYPMLNRALRLMDVDVIIKMGFFIDDLHRQIEKLHLEQFGGHQSGTTFTVYRGQGMSKEDFDQMKKIKGGLMSFSNFLSTSKNCDVSRDFARRAVKNPDLMGIFFVMTVDPSKSTTPFASIHGISYFQEEDEILFSMHTVFRIRDIKPMGENRLFQVELTLTTDNDKDLRALTDCIRAGTSPNSTGWNRLGSLLLDMGQSGKAQQVYEGMLEQTINESEQGRIYHDLGLAKYNQGDYTEALTFYEKALEVYKRTLPPNHLNLANSYNNIGNVHFNMSDYSKALLSYEKALEVYKRTLSPNHPDVAAAYNNIGSVYKNMNDYTKALSSYEKALAIRQQSLPPNHPDLAASYNNIGIVYRNIGEYPKALSSYEKALAIRQQSLPSNHPDLAMSYNNIGTAYEYMNNYSKAHSFYEHAVNIGQQSLPLNHPHLQTYRKNLDDMKKRL